MVLAYARTTPLNGKVVSRTEQMGYDVHITRAREWHESDTTPITLDEWLAYVARDS